MSRWKDPRRVETSPEGAPIARIFLSCRARPLLFRLLAPCLSAREPHQRSPSPRSRKLLSGLPTTRDAVRPHGDDATPETMSALHSGAASLPRGFRYHTPGDSDPKTPEPFASADGEIQPPSAPRPKFRIKRRHASQLAAPTQQFLASVAAADVPIPSIEVIEHDADTEEPMQCPPPPRIHTGDDAIAHYKVRCAPFPPKTPEPESAPSPPSRHYPDWTIDSTWSSDESSPECESSRPSTARSTHTSASLFSRISFTSDDAHCMSPEYDDFDTDSQTYDAPKKPSGVSAKPKGKLRKAPWTRAMSEHLWSTYMMYCHDPKVTPFRAGQNGIPPHGVCIRVAREAKRSWKGSKALLAVSGKSGSSTPTVESSSAYIQWPHTCAATRARLRELCRAKGASSAARTHRYLHHSPTPFGRTATRHRNRRTTPLRSPSIFSSRDMNMSLSMCTADSLQPSAPLAQLTSSALESSAFDKPPAQPAAPEAADPRPEARESHPFRLGSPFTTQSYGPSSSSLFGGAVSPRSSVPPRQSCTLEPRRSLQTPPRLVRSRSNTLQKRRSRQAANEVRRNKRPSLGSDLWMAPSIGLGNGGVYGSSTSRPSLEFSSTSLGHQDDLFVSPANIEDPFKSSQPVQQPAEPLSNLAPPATQPPRLGSPFSGTNSSFSFPNRLSQPTNFFGAIRRPFATVQQPTDDSGGRGNLASRLTYINDRLREFRRRDPHRRRSESPL